MTEILALEGLSLNAAVSYLDAIYTGEGPASAAATAAIAGSPAEKSPAWSYNLWARYTRLRGRLTGAGTALGVVWQDERLGGNGARTQAAPDPLMLPAFTRLDAAFFYRISERIDVAINMENLLDALIFVSGSVGSSLEVAAPRTVTFRIGYRIP